ncbi:uncharacterized protein [Lepeophtheirus salmonis]|uniref:uncharacterized protein n=1 Tax=Lepeophtheirus salmonis TaxID=72036 RepID=UPI003AF3B9B1
MGNSSMVSLIYKFFHGFYSLKADICCLFVGKNFDKIANFHFSHSDKCFYHVTTLPQISPDQTCKSMDAHLPRMKTKSQMDVIVSNSLLQQITLDLIKDPRSCSNASNCILRWRDNDTFINFGNIPMEIDFSVKEKNCFFYDVAGHQILNEVCENHFRIIMCQKDCSVESESDEEANSTHWHLIFSQNVVSKKKFKNEDDILKINEGIDLFSILHQFESFRYYYGFRLKILYPESFKYIEWYQESTILSSMPTVDGFGLIRTNIPDSAFFMGIHKQPSLNRCLFSQYSNVDSSKWFEFGCTANVSELNGPHKKAKHIELFAYLPDNYFQLKPYSLSVSTLVPGNTKALVDLDPTSSYLWNFTAPLSFICSKVSNIIGVMIQHDLLSRKVMKFGFLIRIGHDPNPFSGWNSLCAAFFNAIVDDIIWINCKLPIEGKYIHLFKHGEKVSVQEVFPYDYNIDKIVHKVILNQALSKRNLVSKNNPPIQFKDPSVINVILDDTYEVLALEVIGKSGINDISVHIDSFLSYKFNKKSYDFITCLASTATAGSVTFICPPQSYGRVISFQIKTKSVKISRIVFYLRTFMENPLNHLKNDNEILFNGVTNERGVNIKQGFEIETDSSWGPIKYIYIRTSDTTQNIQIGISSQVWCEKTESNSTLVIQVICINPSPGNSVMFADELKDVKEVELIFGDVSDITRGKYSFHNVYYTQNTRKSFITGSQSMNIDLHSYHTQIRKIVLHKALKESVFNVSISQAKLFSDQKTKNCLVSKPNSNVFYCDSKMKSQMIYITTQNPQSLMGDIFLTGVEVHVEQPSLVTPLERDCWSLYNMNFRQAHIFPIDPSGQRNYRQMIDVKCNGAGWTLILQRIYGSGQVFETKNRVNYINGFGLRTGEHWIGLANVHLLSEHYNGLELRIEIIDMDDNLHIIQYDSFSVGVSPGYKLNINGFFSRTNTHDSFSTQNGNDFFNNNTIGWTGDENNVNFFGVHKRGPIYENNIDTQPLIWKTIPALIKKAQLWVLPKGSIPDEAPSKAVPIPLPLMDSYIGMCNADSLSDNRSTSIHPNVCGDMNCSIAYCFDPPLPPDDTHWIPQSNALSTRINDSFTYVCPYEAVNGSIQNQVSIPCLPNGKFDESMVFPNCSTRECPPLIPNPYGYQITLYEFKLSFKDKCIALHEFIKSYIYQIKWLESNIDKGRSNLVVSTYQLTAEKKVKDGYYLALGFNYPVNSITFESSPESAFIISIERTYSDNQLYILKVGVNNPNGSAILTVKQKAAKRALFCLVIFSITSRPIFTTEISNKLDRSNVPGDIVRYWCPQTHALFINGEKSSKRYQNFKCGTNYRWSPYPLENFTCDWKGCWIKNVPEGIQNFRNVSRFVLPINSTYSYICDRNWKFKSDLNRSSANVICNTGDNLTFLEDISSCRDTMTCQIDSSPPLPKNVVHQIESHGVMFSSATCSIPMEYIVSSFWSALSIKIEMKKSVESLSLRLNASESNENIYHVSMLIKMSVPVDVFKITGSSIKIIDLESSNTIGIQFSPMLDAGSKNETNLVELKFKIDLEYGHACVEDLKYEIFEEKNDSMFWFKEVKTLGLTSFDMDYNYQSSLRYVCKRGMKYITEPKGNLSSICQWNQTWSDLFYSIPGCEYSHCLSPQVPPAKTNLELLDWDKYDMIAIGETITYRCKYGWKFEDDISKDTLNLTCKDDGEFKLPDVWPICVITHYCKPPPKKSDENGFVVIEHPGQYFYDDLCPMMNFVDMCGNVILEQVNESKINLVGDFNLQENTEEHGLFLTFQNRIKKDSISVITDENKTWSVETTKSPTILLIRPDFTSSGIITVQLELLDKYEPLCLLALQCFKELKNNSEDALLIPEFHRAIETTLRYHCSRLKRFNEVEYNYTINCGSDKIWEPSDTIPFCKWYLCEPPPMPKNDSNLTPHNFTEKDVFPLDSFYNYSCKDEHIFIDSSVDTVQAICRENNIWEIIGGWKYCVHPNDINCGDGPKYEGTRVSNNNEITGVNASITYVGQPYRRLVSPSGENIDSWNISCSRNKTWSPKPDFKVLWSVCNNLPEPSSESNLIYKPRPEDPLYPYLNGYSKYNISKSTTIQAPSVFESTTALIITGMFEKESEYSYEQAFLLMDDEKKKSF